MSSPQDNLGLQICYFIVIIAMDIKKYYRKYNGVKVDQHDIFMFQWGGG